MNMKKLITTAFLMALANVSFGQDVICRPSALTGGPDIVAQRVCPVGYSPRSTANSSGSSGGLFQSTINSINDNAQRNRERNAARADAIRQRAHERELLEMQLEAQRNESLDFERWEVTMESPQGNPTFYIHANNDCSLTFTSPELGDARVIGVSRTSNTLSFQSTPIEAGGQSLTLYFDTDINRDRMTGQMTSDLGEFPLQGRRVSGTGNVPQQCITTRSTRNVAAEDRDVEEAQERASSLVEDLTSLGELHEQGILTDEEFNAAKRRLLGL